MLMLEHRNSLPSVCTLNDAEATTLDVTLLRLRLFAAPTEGDTVINCTANRLTLDRGEHLRLIFNVSSDAASDDLAPKDLTGLEIEFQVKNKAGDPDPALIDKSVGSGITILPQSGDTLGQFELVVSSSDTATLAAGVYAYDIYLIEAGERRALRRASQFVLANPVNLP